jgi:tRNA-2-methylthio-N6-dimethylallyladenosine synthase
MVAFLKQGYICHMQLPIQSGSDRMLRLMKRPYAAADIEMIFGLLNEVGFAEFETHIIFGFPGETDDDVEHTMQFILRHRPRYVLASGYMESAGMPSARLPGKVDSGTIQRRLKSAGMRMRNAQILCNTDDCELSTARFRRMNRV